MIRGYSPERKIKNNQACPGSLTSWLKSFGGPRARAEVSIFPVVWAAREGSPAQVRELQGIPVDRTRDCSLPGGPEVLPEGRRTSIRAQCRPWVPRTGRPDPRPDLSCGPATHSPGSVLLSSTEQMNTDPGSKAPERREYGSQKVSEVPLRDKRAPLCAQSLAIWASPPQASESAPDMGDLAGLWMSVCSSNSRREKPCPLQHARWLLCAHRSAGPSPQEAAAAAATTL